MPRVGREQSGTGIYHVMLRGINRQDIFEEPEDYWTFIRILSAVHECPTTSFSICGKTMKNNDSKFNQKPVPLIAQMAGDTWQPYRFTGKELDKQNGLNWYDFGARWYDVAGVPMWTSVDPLAEKYYNVSPYVYCNNNPVMFIDPDGRDYGVTIDSEKQTITITATYYATSDSYESAKSSVDMINAQSGKFQYKMDEVPYTVNFNLKAEDIKSNNIGDLNWKKAMDDSGEANTYLVVPDDYNKMDENTNGRTMGGQDIFVKSSRSKSETGGHEIGHTLGMTHNESGLMTADSSNKMRSKEFNQRDINDMIRYPLNHDRNSDAGKGFLK